MNKNNILGTIAQKIGTSRIFTNRGFMVPITILKIQNITAIKISENQSFLASVYHKQYQRKKNLNKLFAENQSYKKNKIKCFYQSFTNNIYVDSFRKGQVINVNAQPKGKGYLGAVKKYNFSGLESTHGVSLKHRSLGSTGQCQDPGKVFKNKKMSGRKNNKVSVKNVMIIDIDIALQVIVVRGLMPGNNGNYIYINYK